MAERVGFEPTAHLREHTISSRADSTALAPLRKNIKLIIYIYVALDAKKKRGLKE